MQKFWPCRRLAVCDYVSTIFCFRSLVKMSFIRRAKSVAGARKYITHHTFYKGVSYSKQLTEFKALLNMTCQDAIRPA